MPVYSVMNLISNLYASICLAPPWSGVYSTDSGLPALMDSHPPRFSQGRPHCVILWLDGSARCPLPLTAQAGAARQLGDVPRWLLVRGCRMRTLTCSVFKVPSHPFPGCDFIVAQFEAGPESLVDALCYAYLTHFFMLKRLFDFF